MLADLTEEPLTGCLLEVWLRPWKAKTLLAIQLTEEPFVGWDTRTGAATEAELGRSLGVLELLKEAQLKRDSSTLLAK